MEERREDIELVQVLWGGPDRHQPRPRVPPGYGMYRKLAPGPWFKSVDRDEYQRRYREEIIALLDPQQVWDELHALVAPFEPVFLCFEHDPSGCHRQIVARWFEQALNVRVEETG